MGEEADPDFLREGTVQGEGYLDEREMALPRMRVRRIGLFGTPRTRVRVRLDRSARLAGGRLAVLRLFLRIGGRFGRLVGEDGREQAGAVQLDEQWPLHGNSRPPGEGAGLL